MNNPGLNSRGDGRSRSLAAIAVTFTCVAGLTFGPDVSAADEVRFLRDADTLFLNCQDVAKALEYEFKVVTNGRLATFCRSGKNGICLPIRLNPDNHITIGNEVAVTARVLASAMQFSYIQHGEYVSIVLKTLASPGAETKATPAYNATWPEGRGFQKGNTLPDIPLLDLHGEEVRFSRFLGKKYILYCWASW